jgi:hypothetical protein
MKILIAEDDFVSRKIVNTILAPLVQLIMPPMAKRLLPPLKWPLRPISPMI